MELSWQVPSYLHLCLILSVVLVSSHHRDATDSIITRALCH